MKHYVISTIIGLMGIIHGHQYYSPEFNKFKAGQCVSDVDTRFYIDSFKESTYTVIYLDGLLAVVKAKVTIDRPLLDKGFYEISCE